MEQQHRIFSFTLDENAVNYLGQTGRWSRFLAIIGFIMIALIALGGIFAVTMLGSMGAVYGGALATGASVGMGLLYIVIAAFYLYPTIALYRFGKLIRPALANQDQNLLTEALRHLRNVFKFMGILTLIILGLYALIIVFGILGAAIGTLS